MKVERPRHSYEELREVIPDWWMDNGNSDPFKKLWRLVYSKETRLFLEEFPFVHDWLYSPGQLIGAPLGTYHWDQDEGDRVAYWYLKDRGAWMAASNQYRGLRIGGHRAWKENAEMMIEMGDRTYEHYVRRRKSQIGVG